MNRDENIRAAQRYMLARFAGQQPPGWLDQLRIDLGKPQLHEFWRAGINRASYPGIDSQSCVFAPCTRAAEWRLITGDASEHIARLNYCGQHAILVSFAQSLPCTSCGRQMRVDVREKMDVPDHAQ